MHCVLQNITPMLYRIWICKRIPIDSDISPQYSLLRHIDGGTKSRLATISDVLEASRPSIPTSLAHAPRRIDKHWKGFKASEWDAWLTKFGTSLLDQRMPRQYVRNFTTLGRLYQLSTQYTVSIAAVHQIDRLAKEFVTDYERLYYQGEEARMIVCMINGHYLLHLPQYIKDLGPARGYWQFPMESAVGRLAIKAKSKSQLHVSASNAMISKEHINQAMLSRRLQARQGPLLPEPLSQFNPRLSRRNLRLLREVLGENTICYKRYRMNDDLIVGSIHSQRTGDLNRANQYIVYTVPGIQDKRKWQFAEVCYFVHLQDEQESWACIKKCTLPAIDRRERVISCRGQEGMSFIPADWI